MALMAKGVFVPLSGRRSQGATLESGGTKYTVKLTKTDETLEVVAYNDRFEIGQCVTVLFGTRRSDVSIKSASNSDCDGR